MFLDQEGAWHFGCRVSPSSRLSSWVGVTVPGRRAAHTRTRYHCERICPYRVACPAHSIHCGCVVAVQRRLEKCCKYPLVRCRGEGFSAPPITSGCSQALFQTGCFSGRALRLLAGGIQSLLGGFGSGFSSSRWRQL